MVKFSIFGGLILFICAVNVKSFARPVERRDLGFGFPDDEDSPTKSEKKPLFLPSRCKVGELFYPGDQLDDWVCDCKPGHLFFPPRNQCFAAYTRGPCGPNQHLILLSNTVLPVCSTNYCGQDKYVLFRGKCHRLNTAGPCYLPELGVKVAVDAKSLQLDCLPKIVDSRLGGDNDTITPSSVPPSSQFDIPGVFEYYYYEDVCFRGGKRSYEGKCKNKLQT